MIHTKLLIRRLAYVPWLLAFGLVLGWAGEAQAQTIKLSTGPTELREDGGAFTIKVTAKTFNAADAHAAIGARVVQLGSRAPMTLIDDDTDLARALAGYPGIEPDAVDGFGRRFTMTLPSIVIAGDAKEVSVDVVITPIPTNHENDPTVTTEGKAYKGYDRIDNQDLDIYLSGNAGTGEVDKNGSPGDDADAQNAASIKITMLDSNRPSTDIKLSLDPGKVSKEAQATPVKVSGRLNGALVRNQTLSFLLRIEAPISLKEDGTLVEKAGRDADYDIRMSTLSIARRKPSGVTTIHVTPKNVGAGFIGINTEKELKITGTDLNHDGDARDVFTAYSLAQDPQDADSGRYYHQLL